ncbi:GntR family transcriptional regulator [Streptomyces globosus]|uniref:GntR family transcriptional regulator n=1 Tax=Streptomyces globosus TaxID=68209 RepID=UPI0031DFEE10
MGTRPAPYQVVADAFRQAIAEGAWAPGHRLPSRAKLGEEYGVGENVIRRAQELLITEGLLEGRPGAGTYVRERQERLTMTRFPALGHPSAPLAPEGVASWEASSIAKVPAPDAVATRLAITPGEHTVRTAYEFLDSARRPLMIATSWEPMAITGTTAVVLPDGGPLAGRSVVDRMAYLGIEVVRADERTRPVHLDREQGHLLGAAAGSLATLIERTYYDSGNRPVETADLLIPADRWTIDYRLHLTTGQPPH